MTYCLAISVREGLVLASDSRTHAGLDQVSSYSKMHMFGIKGSRQIVLLTSGNLATTQAVTAALRRDIEGNADLSLHTVEDITDAADYIGGLSRSIQEKYVEKSQGCYDASFIIGGQIRDNPPGVMLVYPEGNSITATPETPYLQIGESKYGKPVLDRFIRERTPLDPAARCALVSMDSTMRSNATVAPPIEMVLYQRDSFVPGRKLVLDEDSDYLREVRQCWDMHLHEAFGKLPSINQALEGEPRLPLAKQV